MSDPAPRRKLLSVVTPVYNEEDSVLRCYEEVRRVATSLGPEWDYEHVFGDNRSTDRTPSILRELAARDPRVRVLTYARNYGAERSAITLLRHASGDVAVGFVADLQDPPAVLPRMIELWQEGFEVVYGVYRNPHERPPLSWLRSAYYRLVAALSEHPLPRDFTGFALLDRRVLDQVVSIDDHSPYLRGFIATAGFRQIPLHFDRQPRLAGSSKHGLRFLFDFGLNAIVSYSVVPIRVAAYAGALLASGSFALGAGYAMLLVLRAVGIVRWAIETPAAAALVVLVLFFAGVQLLFLGVVGEYIGGIHAQVRRRPFVVIDQRLGFPTLSERRPRAPAPSLEPEAIEAIRRAAGVAPLEHG